MKPIDEDLLVESVKRGAVRVHSKEINNNVCALLHNLHSVHSPREMN